MKTRNVAAVDLGASSGRVLLARYDGEQLSLEEIHRFPNHPLQLRGHRLWNMPALWDETLAGLRKARERGGTLDSIGVATWGVDYGLVDEHGLLLSQPFQYRDHRTDGMMEQVLARIPRSDLYARTGIQFLSFNTLYQLYAHERQQPGDLARAHRLLLIPDLLHSWLCGEQVSERTNATTTQCWDALAGTWARDLLAQLSLPATMLPPVVEAGTSLGRVVPEMHGDLGAAQVIAPATHDTGSAIAAVPVTGTDGWGYISSGTWSLVGVELPRPLISAEALEANCTNEGGVFGTTRFLKNVMGLWLLQECQRQWSRANGEIDYERLLAFEDGIPLCLALIDPDDPRFLAPENMPEEINRFLSERGQQPLESPIAFSRCIMESLVLRYVEVFHQISVLTGMPITQVHVLGGGARNKQLNQWLADALGFPVIAGPYEATAYGNALMQLVGLGELQSLSEVRAVAQKVPTEVFLPQPNVYSIWQEAAHRFRTLNVF
jgi:rhamnulokinase